MVQKCPEVLESMKPTWHRTDWKSILKPQFHLKGEEQETLKGLEFINQPEANRTVEVATDSGATQGNADQEWVDVLEDINLEYILG